MTARNLQLDPSIAIFDHATGEFYTYSVLGVLLDCPTCTLIYCLTRIAARRVGVGKSLTAALNEMIQKARLPRAGFTYKV
jgi:hypothetical protein